MSPADIAYPVGPRKKTMCLEKILYNVFDNLQWPEVRHFKNKAKRMNRRQMLYIFCLFYFPEKKGVCS